MRHLRVESSPGIRTYKVSAVPGCAERPPASAASARRISRERGRAHLELLGGRLAGREEALDLVPDARGSRGRAASRAGARRRRTAPPPPRRSPAAATRARQRPRMPEQPLGDQLAGHREDQQGRDQVGAAALVLLGGVGGVEAAALIGADRLVLDAVVGGQVAIAKRRRGRQHAEQPRSRPRAGGAAAGRRAQAADRAADRRGGERDREHPRVLDRQARRGQAAAGDRDDRERLRQPQRARGAAASSRAAPREHAAWGPRRPRSGRRGVRAAAAQALGPWIRRPLRSAIPPRRSGSAWPAVPLPTAGSAEAPFPDWLIRAPPGRCRDRSAPRARCRRRPRARRRCARAAPPRAATSRAEGRSRRRSPSRTPRGTSGCR